MEIKMANENVFNDLKRLAEIKDLDDFTRKYFAYFIQQGVTLDELNAVFAICAKSTTIVKDIFSLLAVTQKWTQYELVLHAANAVEATRALDDEELLKDIAESDEAKMFATLLDMTPRQFVYWVSGYMTVTRGAPCESSNDVTDAIVDAMRIALEHQIGIKGGK